MFQPPKSMKYRKRHKGRNRGLSRASNISFGTFGLRAKTRGTLNARQIEAVRRVIARVTKRQGTLWIRIFPDKPVTKKPLEVRQGKGKGNVEFYIFEVKPGAMLFELAGVSEEIARKAFKLACDKLPLTAEFVKAHADVAAQTSEQG